MQLDAPNLPRLIAPNLKMPPAEYAWDGGKGNLSLAVRQAQSGTGGTTGDANSTSQPPPASTPSTPSTGSEPPSTAGQSTPTPSPAPAPAPSTTAPAPSQPSSSAPPPPSSSAPPPPPPSSSSAAPPPSTPEPAPAPAPSSTSTPAPAPSVPSSTPVAPSTTPTPAPNPPTTTVETSLTPTSTSTVIVTSTTTGRSISSSTTSTPSQSPTPVSGGSSGGGLSSSGKVAIGVVVPIAAIAILAVIGLFWWRKRKARLESEEERRKEVEDYSYNPNADPTIPAVGLVGGGAGGDNGYEMREDTSNGYRGWGSTTAAGSVGRKASTTLSNPGAFSDATTARAPHDAHDGNSSQEGEILGAMGPSAANNRADVRRGPSNASSSYSATGRSEGSDSGLYGGGPAAYYDQYSHGAYGDGGAVIRDNPARRNTQIENTSHFPQQSAGIAQNF
ncbi:hypothetical protein ACQRIT_004897 [Beauveria bassiana]